jgi:adenine deaminase
VWHVPTTVIVRALREYGCNGKPLSECPYYAYVNAKEREDWQGIIDTLKEIPRFKNFDDEAAVKRARLFAETSDRVLVGTDQANPGVVAGFSFLDELELMVRDLGLTPYEVLQRASVLAAEYLEIAGRVGTVEEGKQADLLLVDANPLEDISNVRQLSAVIKAGVVYDRSRLDALLEQVRSMKVDDIEFVGQNAVNPLEKR